MKFILIRLDFDMEVRDTEFIESDTFPDEEFDQFSEDKMTQQPGEQFICLSEDQFAIIAELFQK